LKLFLDSTYLIPALNIDITEGWSKQDLLNLIKSDNYDLYYCDLSLFEIYTKCMKLILQKRLSVEIKTVQRGIESILYSPKLHKLDWHEHLSESEIILKLKELHNDSIDCMLFYISVVVCDSFATFDSTFIKEIKKNQSIMKWIKGVNLNFIIWMNNLKGEKISIFK
jgi:predicted nucleic acid-binding protein